MLDIVEYPNAGLKRQLEPVTEFKPSLKQLADEMLMAMYAENGVGLAASQVGFGGRLLVMDPTAGDSANAVRVLINPSIIETSKEMTTGEEGCLSIPGTKLSVLRHAWVTVEYFDVEGKPHKEAFVDWAARIVQHEYDHLDGILMLDRVGPLQRQLALKSLRKGR